MLGILPRRPKERVRDPRPIEQARNRRARSAAMPQAGRQSRRSLARGRAVWIEPDEFRCLIDGSRARLDRRSSTVGNKVMAAIDHSGIGWRG